MSSSRMASYRVSTDIDSTEAEKVWKGLQSAIRQIFKSNEGSLSFEELYRSGYTLVLHKFGKFLYTNVEKEIRANLEEVFRGITTTDDNLFLASVVKAWTFYKIRMSMVADVLMYMDRNFVDTAGLPLINNRGLQLFYECIIKKEPVRKRLKDMILRQIRSDRDGKPVDKEVLREVLKILVEVGIDSRSVYQIEFEELFLAETANYYRAEAEEHIGNVPCSKYLERVQNRINQEKQKCRTYLDASSKAPLLEVLQAELVSNHCEEIVTGKTGCRFLFENHAIEDLERMHSLIKKVPKALELASDVFQEFILSTGGQIVEENQTEKQALKYVNLLLQARDNYVEILLAFKKEKLFKKALNTGLDKVVNLKNLTPHFLALFVDDMMKSKAKGKIEHLSMNALELTFGKVISIFKHLHARDVFENYYKQLLAKRLLAKKKDFTVDIAFEAEKIMIKKLKAEIGQEFTTKLENMLNDMENSSQETREFLQSDAAENNLGLESFAVTVLTREMWPYQANEPPIVPEALKVSLMENFNDWYVGKHDGRKLNWLMYLGHAEIESTFKGKTYKLVVTSYQMLILQLFNERAEMSYTQIKTLTNIPEAELWRHLISLTTPKYKLLNKEPKGKSINPNDKYSINEDFSSKYDRVRIPLVSARTKTKAEKSGETAENELPGNIREDRKQLTDAAIVRILKTRKVISHNELIAETVKHLSARFRPSPVDIKKRIASLIDREFIERDEEDNRTYKYVAY